MPFLLVSYFEKQRQLFLNQNFVVRDENEIRRLDRGTFRLMDMTRMIDINTGDTVRLDPGEMWTCVDVTLMDSEYQYYFTPFLIFRNEDREIRFRFESRDINDFFMLEAEHLERVAVEEERRRERKQAEEERMRLAEEGRVAAEEERVRLRNEHIRRWGSDLGNTIADGGVRIGMTKEMAIAAWGEPTRINRTTTRHGRREQWVYGGRNNLYFENGILTAIQN
ncbi:MAG: DUF2845 domain-containing protein [Lentimicrobiaceae bacterium]|nr:DUF2845 domain-containing protein [Lentimicrobiaceae bacterium]